MAESEDSAPPTPSKEPANNQDDADFVSPPSGSSKPETSFPSEINAAAAEATGAEQGTTSSHVTTSDDKHNTSTALPDAEQASKSTTVTASNDKQQASTVDNTVEHEDQPPLPADEAPSLPDGGYSGQQQSDGWEWLYEPFGQQGAWYHAESNWWCYTNNFCTQDPSQHFQPQLTTTTTQQQELHPAVANGYNPAIHGSYDPNADYAKGINDDDLGEAVVAGNSGYLGAMGEADYGATANFNRFTGRFQNQDVQPENYDADHRSGRQLNAFFDANRAANEHDGRSLKAERRDRQLSKKEVQQFREKRRKKKEDKRRAWLAS